jgi:transposase
MNTRIIGIDLAVTARHRAAILDPATGQFLVKELTFTSSDADLDRLLARAQAGVTPAPRLIVILEATSMAWHPVSLYLAAHGATLFRVNGRMTKEMRRVSSPHARSDRLDGQALAQLYTTCRARLVRLQVPSGAELTFQRACREFAQWRGVATAITNRLTAYDNWAWQGLTHLVPAAALNWVRTEWYDPWTVVAIGPTALRALWQQTAAGAEDDAAWIPAWVARASALTRLFGHPRALDYPGLMATIRRNLVAQAYADQLQQTLYTTVIAPLYQRLYPDCLLTSIYGIGPESAAIYMAFIHSITRFPSVARFRQWTGMVPASDQSGSAQNKGLPLTQAGPNIIKATLYLNANVARQWDPQLAQIYYTQMVGYGKHHTQAVCACASHLANRIYTVLKENRPYELRDLEGKPILAADAHRLIQERLHVPEDVRQRTTKRWRQGRHLMPTQ